MRKSLSVSLFVLLIAMGLTMPASATSWFAGKKAPGMSAAYQSYRGHKAMRVVHPGGWGSPTRVRDMGYEAMAYSAVVIERQRTILRDIGGGRNLRAKAQAAAIARQNIANTIKPLGTPYEGDKPVVQKEKMPRQFPKVPVAEWEKLNQRNAQQPQTKQ